jgi:hypothetical protein
LSGKSDKIKAATQSFSEVLIVKVKTGLWSRALVGVIGIWFLTSLNPVTASAASVTLAWDPNTEADLAGYKVHVGSSPGVYTQTTDAGHVTTFAVPDLLAGETYYFAVTAYDILANESGFSGEISTTIAIAPGPAPEGSTTTTSGNEEAGEPSGYGQWWGWWRWWRWWR